MPGPEELFEKFDPITADFTYIRWLGDRKGIETVTKVWNKTIVDHTAQLQTWVQVCHKILRRGVTVYAYANNHYSGFGPATVEQFRQLCAVKEIQTPLNKHADNVYCLFTGSVTYCSPRAKRFHERR